jgi:hypothetical protein
MEFRGKTIHSIRRPQMNPMTPRPLTNMQMELLKIFAIDLSEEELADIRTVLAKHFADRLSRRVDEIWEEKGLTQADMERWLNEAGQ